MSPHGKDRIATGAIAMLIIALAILAGLFVTGCKTLRQANAARAIVAGQTPGEATGAGATLRGPANSAAPSTQVSEKRVAYFPPARSAAKNRAILQEETKSTENIPTRPEAPFPPLPPVKGLESIDPPAPAWTYEHTETTLGAHQDAAGIIKVATVMNNWGRMQWIGLVVIIGSLGTLLWSAGHDKGYPMVYVKTGLCGIAFMFCDSPWWLLLGVIPLGFWAMQKLGLLNLPKFPLR